MSKFCTKCGGRIAEDSLFCEYCGNKVKTSVPTQPLFAKESQPPKKPVFSSYNQTSPPPSYTSSYRPYHRSSTNWAKWVFIGVFFVVIVGFAAVILIGLAFLPFSFNVFNQYEYIGDLNEYIGENLTNNSAYIDLEVDNSIGAVNIDIVENIKFFEAQIHVYAREGYHLYEANTIEYEEYNNHYFITFDSSSDSDWENPYLYELDILISNRATTELNIEVSTGAISVGAYQTNISSLYLDTSTGSITVDFSEVYFSASQDFTLHTSTGSITADFFELMYYSSEVEWMIDTSTGSISVDLFQESIDNNTLIYYNAGTSTGSIDFHYALNSSIGLQIYADVSTGTINTPDYSTDDEYTYKSENYDSASMKIYVFLDTSTGSIHIL
ncbi:MAG: zinc ribbon domain-containing protein [Candidatus Heimdallarchaeota archaeon]|nr:MAG: zinc ribbon domain-containing protein [Candidatus Heimdallarchaeota archaeon]